MVIYHIRKPIADPKRRHVSLRHVDLKGVETMCGAAPTEHDIRSSASDWADATPIGNYQACEHCIAAKAEANRKKNRASGSAAAMAAN